MTEDRTAAPPPPPPPEAEPTPEPADDTPAPQVMAYGEQNFRTEQPEAPEVAPPVTPEDLPPAPPVGMMGGFGGGMGGVPDGMAGMGMGGMPGSADAPMDRVSAEIVSGDDRDRAADARTGAAAPVATPLRLLAGPRAFERVGDEWRQRGYAGEEAPAIARDSDAFAQLLQRYPELHTLTLQPDAVVFAVDDGWRRLEPAPEPEQ